MVLAIGIYLKTFAFLQAFCIAIYFTKYCIYHFSICWNQLCYCTTVLKCDPKSYI